MQRKIVRHISRGVALSRVQFLLIRFVARYARHNALERPSDSLVHIPDRPRSTSEISRQVPDNEPILTVRTEQPEQEGSHQPRELFPHQAEPHVGTESVASAGGPASKLTPPSWTEDATNGLAYDTLIAGTPRLRMAHRHVIPTLIPAHVAEPALPTLFSIKPSILA